MNILGYMQILAENPWVPRQSTLGTLTYSGLENENRGRGGAFAEGCRWNEIVSNIRAMACAAPCLSKVSCGDFPLKGRYRLRSFIGGDQMTPSDPNRPFMIILPAIGVRPKAVCEALVRIRAGLILISYIGRWARHWLERLH